MIRILFIALSLVVFQAATVTALANKASVEIQAPSTAKNGETVTITLNVSHRGNNLIHHTMFAYVKVNGAEVGRWEWKQRHFESEKFSRQVSVKADKTLAIEAEAQCNLHGSAGKEICVGGSEMTANVPGRFYRRRTTTAKL